MIIKYKYHLTTTEKRHVNYIINNYKSLPNGKFKLNRKTYEITNIKTNSFTIIIWKKIFIETKQDYEITQRKIYISDLNDKKKVYREEIK